MYLNYQEFTIENSFKTDKTNSKNNR